MRKSLMYDEYRTLLAELLELLERRGAKAPEMADDLNLLEPDIALVMAMLEDRMPLDGHGLWVRVTNALYLTLHNPQASKGQQIAALGLLLHVYTKDPIVAKDRADDIESITRALHILALQEVLGEKMSVGLMTYIPDDLRPDKPKPPTE